MLEKKKVGVICGGMSTEHEVSLVSGKSVFDNIDRDRYEVVFLNIDKEGNWCEEGNKPIKNIIEQLKKFDVIFPVLHGKYGEDGTIQGLLDLAKIPYVGCGVLASSLCMDKVYTKRIFEKAKIPQAKYIYLKNENIYVDENLDETELNNSEIAELIEEKLGYPVFVKPSNSGSSVGINKATNAQSLIQAIEEAGMYDSKILIEQAIIGKEVECAVLGNDKLEASTVGQIISADEFYTYDAKYNNVQSRTQVPADLSEDKIREIQTIAKKAFRAVDGKGLARVDFFVEDKTEKVIINEINTMPGFTKISLYPKLWDYNGVEYKELLTRLIELAIEK